MIIGITKKEEKKSQCISMVEKPNFWRENTLIKQLKIVVVFVPNATHRATRNATRNTTHNSTKKTLCDGKFAEGFAQGSSQRMEIVQA